MGRFTGSLVPGYPDWGIQTVYIQELSGNPSYGRPDKEATGSTGS